MESTTLTSSTLAASDGQATATTDLYLAGVGSVGRALLEQVGGLSSPEHRLQLVGACTSGRAVWSGAGLAPDAVDGALEQGRATDWPQILRRLVEHDAHPLVFVDATGNLDVASHYERLLRAGVHVVTPSKLAFTREQAHFDALHAAAAEGGARLRYETTAGAGLPVVRTVRDLVATGDRIREIRGAVSGTLTFIFSQVRQGAPFSEAVREAARQGYAEPDVRDDLSGEDVARKFLILARTAGVRIERDGVQVESLVPSRLHEVAPEQFLERLPEEDAQWRTRADDAAGDDAALQYVGRLAEGTVHVGVQAVANGSPFGRLTGTDNLVEIYTDRYDTSPLAVRGPGAGPQVTAAGVLADVLEAAGF